MHQIRFQLGLHPRPHCGSLQRSPRPLATFKGGLLLRGGKRRKGGKEGRREKGRRRKGGERKGESGPPRI